MALTNDEAKDLYVQAVQHLQAHAPGEALAVLDRLDAERPNSRHVLQQRAKALIGLDRLEEAESLCARLEGKLEPPHLEELRAAIVNARMLGQSGVRRPEPTPVPPAPTPAPRRVSLQPPSPVLVPKPDVRNVMTVESVFPVSVEEATVTGHVDSGVFHTGDMVTVVTPEGAPLSVLIKRIGSVETPINLVRAGQRAVLLLAVEPNLVVPGTAISSAKKEEAYAATMMADTAQPSPDEDQPLPAALVEVERQMRSHAFDDALGALTTFLAVQPDHRVAQRMIARVYLDAGTHIRNPHQALEHIRRAYELGGAQDPVVVEVLAEALAETGEAEHGLKFLERLHQSSQDPQARGALTARIRDFRGRNRLGQVWEFADAYGDVLFESADMAEIVKALKSGTVPRNAKCRRDRIGEWQSVETTLGPLSPDIAALYAPGTSTASWVFPALVMVLVAVIVAAVVLL